MNLVFAGKLKAVIGKVFPLAEARAAEDSLEKFEAFGKVVLAIE
jgi:NADPH:quinone reductase-like Zn-dependent oxidoreductase